MYIWNWRTIGLYKEVFLQGALTTLWLTFVAVLFGTLLGVVLAFMKRSQNPIFSRFASFFIEVFRALPILVLLIWIFYVFPILFSWKLSPFAAAAIALATNLSAFVAETVRAGIESVPKGQYESGIVLGLRPYQVMLVIVLPQAIRNIVPNMIGLYAQQLKNSSLASVIGVNELLHRSNILISNTFRPLEIYTAVAVMYLIIIVPLVLLGNHYEGRLRRRVKTA